MIRWVEIRQPARPNSPWLRWVRWHGIEPNDVALHVIECDDTAQTITYREPSPLSIGGDWHVVQLEAVALPFPDSDEYPTGIIDDGYSYG